MEACLEQAGLKIKLWLLDWDQNTLIVTSFCISCSLLYILQLL